MVQFVSSHGMKYILVVVDYVSKWVESIELPNNIGKSVTTFLKRTSSSDQTHPELSSMMEACIFAIFFSKTYLINMV